MASFLTVRSVQPGVKAVLSGRRLFGNKARIQFRHGARASIDAQLAAGRGAVTAPAVTDAALALEEEVAPAAGPGRRGTRERTFSDVPLTTMRKVIASRLTGSKANIPHYYSRIDCRIDAMLEYRQVLKEAGIKVSVNDMVIRAAALALRDVPAANCQWDEAAGRPVPNATVDISVAVATPGGLITPIVHDCDQIGLQSINKGVAELAGRAREGKLAPEEYTGGSFTISNLGMFGIKEFSAVINPPQACILAVGGGVGAPCVGASGDAEAMTKMTVNLSSDRRVVDERTAANYLSAFQRYAETPMLLASV